MKTLLMKTEESNTYSPGSPCRDTRSATKEGIASQTKPETGALSCTAVRNNVKDRNRHRSGLQKEEKVRSPILTIVNEWELDALHIVPQGLHLGASNSLVLLRDLWT
jgi:hypothetical protein